MQLKNIPEYIFYCAYKILLKIGKKDPIYMPEFKTIIFIGLWELFYLLNFLLFYAYISKIEGTIFPKFPYDDKIIGIGLTALLIGLNYLFFMKNQRYKKIFERFSSNKEYSRRIYLKTIAIAFFILPLIGLYFLIFHSGIVK